MYNVTNISFPYLQREGREIGLYMASRKICFSFLVRNEFCPEMNMTLIWMVGSLGCSDLTCRVTWCRKLCGLSQGPAFPVILWRMEVIKGNPKHSMIVNEVKVAWFRNKENVFSSHAINLYLPVFGLKQISLLQRFHISSLLA